MKNNCGRNFSVTLTVVWVTLLIFGQYHESFSQVKEIVPVKEGPFSKKPVLEPLLETKEKTVLEEDKALVRELNTGPWVEMELNLQFPKLTSDGQTSEFKVRMDLVDKTDSFIWFRQKRESGKVRGAVFVASSAGNWDQESRPVMIKSPMVINGGFKNGTYRISYRLGLWEITSEQLESSIWGYVADGQGYCDRLILEASERPVVIESMKVRSSARTEVYKSEERSNAEKKGAALNKEMMELYRANKFEEATEIAAQLVQIDFQTWGRYHPHYLGSLGSHAALAGSKGDFETTESLYRQMENMNFELFGKHHPRYGRSLNNLGSYYFNLGRYDECEPLFLANKEIIEKSIGKQTEDYLLTINNLANLYKTIGRFDQALPFFAKSLNIKRQTLGDDHVSLIRDLQSVGLMHVSLNFELGKAEQAFRKALSITEKHFGKDHPNSSSTLFCLGRLAQENGQHLEATKLFQKCLEITAALENRAISRRRLYSGLAVSYEKLGQLDKALATNLESKKIIERTVGKNNRDYINCLADLGHCYFKMGQLEKSVESFMESKSAFEKVFGESHNEYAVSLTNLAIAKYRSGELSNAEPLILRALAITRRKLDHFSSLQSEFQQQKFTAQYYRDFSLVISTSLQLGNREKQIAEQVINWMGINQLRQNAYLKLSELPQLKDDFAKLRLVQSKLTQHINLTTASQAWIDTKKKLVGEEARLEKKIAAEAARNLIPFQGFSLDDFRLPPQASLVVFKKFQKVVTGAPDEDCIEHYLAVIVDYEGQVKAIDLGPEEKINLAVNHWRRAINENNNLQVVERLGRVLRERVWEPIEPALKNSKLVIIAPDAELGQASFVALPGKTSGTYLIEEKSIVYSSVPILLTSILSRPAKQLDRKTKSLLIGGVDYGDSKQVSPNALASRNRVLLGNMKFSDLPYTQKEVRFLKNVFENSTLLSDQIVGKDVNPGSERQFKAKLPKHQLLHISTHGFFIHPKSLFSETNKPPSTLEGFRRLEQAKLVGQNPDLLSGLAFSNANHARDRKTEDLEDDGIIYSAEIARLNMNRVEIAVLSACETSLGINTIAGEGLTGIQRAFQIAGAKTTVASSWKVSDQATQLLMNKFYTNLIDNSSAAKSAELNQQNSTIRIDALRNAQLWMLNNAEIASSTNRGEPVEIDPAKIKKLTSNEKTGRTHPRYWAAFNLAGDWR